VEWREERLTIEKDDIRFVIDWGKRDLRGEEGEVVRGRCYDVCVISFILLIIMSLSLSLSAFLAAIPHSLFLAPFFFYFLIF